MPSVHEQLTEQFRKWEIRGRGWRVFPEPVCPEPPFYPFLGYQTNTQPAIDDGRRPSFLGSLLHKVAAKSELPPLPPIIAEPADEPDPEPLSRESLIELQTSLPVDLDINKEAFGQFLRNLASCAEPVAFELLGSKHQVNVQFATSREDAPKVRRQLTAYFPEAAFLPREGTLESAWESCEGEEALLLEFGLLREFMFALASDGLDPFIGLIGTLAELGEHELGLFQVLFQATQNPWAESIISSVTLADGKPFFINQPELTGAAKHKVSRPLYAAVVRVATKAKTRDRVLAIACDLAASLSVFSNPQGNELIPLANDEYPFYEHIDDVILRQSRRPGMLLNSDELIGFVHLPSSAIRSTALARDAGKTKSAPAIVRNRDGLCLGVNTHMGETVPIRLTPEQRVRHTHIIGASGTGKSTLFFNLISEGIANGEGLAVLDPHGDLIDRICGTIPEERINDVILVDPSDAAYSVGFNILSAHSEIEKELLASDLVAVFERLSTSWGDQMNSVLQNGVLAFLESDRPGTLADLRRFLVEPAFRSDFLKSVRDSEVLYYWQKSFPHLAGNKSIGSILTRLDTFLAKKPIRHMVSQPENRLDFARMMDSGKIFLAKLPEGLLGRENSHLLGTLLISKFQQIAMSRQAQNTAARRPFWIYIDEFANFITPTMAEILSGARKYRVGLTLAHHELHQLQRSPDVASAVMTHPFTRIVFRVGDDDAKRLADGFSHFEAMDLRNLEAGQAICRVDRSDFDFNLSVTPPSPLDEDAVCLRRQEVITASRTKFGRARTEVEAMLLKSHEPPVESATPHSPKVPSTASSPQAVRQTRAEESPSPLPPVVVPPPSELPQTPEVAKTAVSARGEPDVATPEEPPEIIANTTVSNGLPPVPVKSRALRDLGRGGAQHKAIQLRIKSAGEEVGFRSQIEQPVLGGQGSVDVWLERSGHVIACEISITNTIDYEVGNVAKCLKAGVPAVAMICLDEERLRKIRMAISGSLGPELASRVAYFHPDQFIAHLTSLPVEQPKETETIRRGYKIKRVHSEVSHIKQKDDDAAAVRAIAEIMRRKKSA